MLTGPVLVDANLLLLYVVGSADRSYIGVHKRLKAYHQVDFDLLNELLGSKISRIVVLPNILTEVSNLAVQTFPEAKRKILLALATLVDLSDERFITSIDATNDPSYMALGLTDAAILLAAAPAAQQPTILTADLDLAIQAEINELRVVNFNHLRDDRSR